MSLARNNGKFVIMLPFVKMETMSLVLKWSVEGYVDLIGQSMVDEVMLLLQSLDTCAEVSVEHKVANADICLEHVLKERGDNIVAGNIHAQSEGLEKNDSSKTDAPPLTSDSSNGTGPPTAIDDNPSSLKDNNNTESVRTNHELITATKDGQNKENERVLKQTVFHRKLIPTGENKVTLCLENGIEKQQLSNPKKRKNNDYGSRPNPKRGRGDSDKVDWDIADDLVTDDLIKQYHKKHFKSDQANYLMPASCRSLLSLKVLMLEIKSKNRKQAKMEQDYNAELKRFMQQAMTLPADQLDALITRCVSLGLFAQDNIVAKAGIGCLISRQKEDKSRYKPGQVLAKWRELTGKCKSNLARYEDLGRLYKRCPYVFEYNVSLQFLSRYKFAIVAADEMGLCDEFKGDHQ